MNEITVNKMDNSIHEYNLSNGLKVFIYKTPSFNKKIAYFQTKYGSIDNEFVPIKMDKIKKYPLGIAHFLEHKMFESENNIDYFKLFQEKGAYLNAATSFDKTYYYFTCFDHFNENLINLINLVQCPYFTEENTEKEKGIIGQEIDMYKNNPDYLIYDTLYMNSIVNDARRYDIAGTKKEIDKITYKDLYECYNTFYHPSNMFLTIVGDVNEEEVIKLIEEEESKKKFDKFKKIERKKVIEPIESFKKEEITYHNVSFKKTGYAYKFRFESKSIYDDYQKRSMIETYIKSNFGKLAEFNEYLIKEGLIKSYFNYSIDIFEGYGIIIFDGDIIDEDKVKELIDEKLNNYDDLKKKFELYKKAEISNYIKVFESTNSICGYIRGMYSNYGEIISCCDKLLEDITFEDYINYIRQVDFVYVSKVKVLPKES